MEIVGSMINTSLKGVDEMIERRDEKRLLEICAEQMAYDVDMISLNCATRLDTEVEDIEWMASTILRHYEIPLMPDTPNPAAAEAVLKLNRYGRPMVDSTTCERSRIEAVMPLVKKYDARVVVLLHDEKGMPKTLEDRLALMPLVNAMAAEYGVAKGDMYLDSLVFPLSVGHENGVLYMDCLKALKAQYPEYKTTCGLNNISYGLPEEPLLNITYLNMLMALGQDCAFVEVDKVSGAFIMAARALMGKDEYTLSYIGAYKQKSLVAL